MTHTTAYTWLEWGTIPAVTLCLAAYFQIRGWRRGPATPEQARLRARWEAHRPFPLLGVRQHGDGWAYTMAGRPLAPLPGGKATVALAPCITALKPRTGIAVLTFPDGTVHRHRFSAKMLPEAQRQAVVFNTREPVAAASFRRTRPASMAATP